MTTMLPIRIVIAIGVLTFLVLVFGEITPKSYATQNAAKLACKYSKLFYFLSRILSPIIWILNRITTALIRMVGGKIGDEPLITKESIKSIAEIGAEEGVLAESEKDIIHRVVGVEYKNCSATWKEVKKKIAEDEAGFTSILRETLMENKKT